MFLMGTECGLCDVIIRCFKQHLHKVQDGIDQALCCYAVGRPAKIFVSYSGSLDTNICI
jgi:hypothetical protein